MEADETAHFRHAVQVVNRLTADNRTLAARIKKLEEALWLAEPVVARADTAVDGFADEALIAIREALNLKG